MPKNKVKLNLTPLSCVARKNKQTCYHGNEKKNSADLQTPRQPVATNLVQSRVPHWVLHHDPRHAKHEHVSPLPDHTGGTRHPVNSSGVYTISYPHALPPREHPLTALVTISNKGTIYIQTRSIPPPPSPLPPLGHRQALHKNISIRFFDEAESAPSLQLKTFTRSCLSRSFSSHFVAFPSAARKQNLLRYKNQIIFRPLS